jgi:GTPase Era involved in 16S rRNA processing
MTFGTSDNSSQETAFGDPGFFPRNHLSDVAARMQTEIEGISPLTEGAGRHDLTARLSSEVQRLELQSPITLVVAGETKVGKSSLINGLVGQPTLMPVDVTVATSVFVLVAYGEEVTSRIIFLEGAGEPRSVPLAELSEWVSVEGNPRNRKQVRNAEVTVPSELLRQGIVLVDTPGVGGLDAIHGQVTLAALSSADALLFVLEAGAPMSRPEVTFLARASERIDTVTMVLTKTDQYPQWRVVLDEDRRLLEEAAPRFAHQPIYAVSAELGIAATDRVADGDVEGGERLLNQSGLTELHDALLRDVLNRRMILRLANGVRSIESVLGELNGIYDRYLSSLAGDESPLIELQRQQDLLRTLTSSGQSWQTPLANAYSRIQRKLGDMLQDEVASLRDRYGLEINQRWRRGRQETIAASGRDRCRNSRDRTRTRRWFRRPPRHKSRPPAPRQASGPSGGLDRCS